MACSCEVDPIGCMLKTRSLDSRLYKRAPPPSKGSSDKVIIIVLATVGSLLLILALAVFYCCVRKRRAYQRIDRLQRFLPTVMDQEKTNLYFQRQGSSTTRVGTDAPSKELSPPSNVHHKTRSTPIALTKDMPWLLEHDTSLGQFQDVSLVPEETVVETKTPGPRRSLFGRPARTRAAMTASPALIKSSLYGCVSLNKHNSQSSSNSRTDPMDEEDENHLAEFAEGESLIAPNQSPDVSHFKEKRNSAAASASDFVQKEYKKPTTFKELYESWKRLLPYIWPSNSWRLQGHIMLCLGLLVAGRIVNVLVPRQVANVVNALKMVAEENPGGMDKNGNPRFVWKDVMVFIALKGLQGELGVIDTFQDLLWIPVGQFNTRELAVKLFEHLLNLSLRFHLNRKTGELLRIQDRGVLSIETLLSTLLFNIFPCLVDVAVACFIFTYSFDIFFGVIVGVTMICYIYVTILMTDWRMRYRRESNDLENAVEARAVDCLLNYETIKLFATEEFESQKYTDAIHAFQKADRKSQYTLVILNTILNVVIQGGLAAGCLLCAQRVTQKEMTVSDFIMYYAYILQLYAPLDRFGTSYRFLQKNFVDMEMMLDVLKEPVEIQDNPNAKPLVISGGEVVFENVSFGYKPQDLDLKSVSFKIPPGKKLALVGPSGGGKSTIMRLLFRFYDPTQGRILIDGQDIKNVTQSSLRKWIGIVPQDTALFNQTIEYNIDYGQIGQDHKSAKSGHGGRHNIAYATEGEDTDYSDDEGLEVEERVQTAAEAAQIHEIVSRFPDGYATRVGERGLRLSGGEKQRIAIARTILKNPPILLLDEATSALDTHTEREIQNSLETTSKGRTTLIIAHRLSTIVGADKILVIQRGEIAEQGSHAELMLAGGIYASMWIQQLREDQAPVGGSDTREKESYTDGEDSDEVDFPLDHASPLFPSHHFLAPSSYR